MNHPRQSLKRPVHRFRVDVLALGAALLMAGGACACAVPAVGTPLSNPNGLAVDGANNLYLADQGANEVVEFSVQRNSNLDVAGLTPIACIDAKGPTRLAFDGLGDLYVTNTSGDTVSVFNPSFKLIATIRGLSRPLGIAVDGGFNVYIAENATNAIAIYQPKTAGQPSSGFSQASFSPLTQDAGKNAFLAPGFIAFNSGNGGTLAVGLGPTSGVDTVLFYRTPLTASSTPEAFLNNGANCPSGPSGPTGFASTASGTPYITNYYSSTVNTFTTAGIISGCPMGNPVLAASSLIAQPEGVAVDSNGNLFVSNAGSKEITVYNHGLSNGGFLPNFVYP